MRAGLAGLLLLSLPGGQAWAAADPAQIIFPEKERQGMMLGGSQSEHPYLAPGNLFSVQLPQDWKTHTFDKKPDLVEVRVLKGPGTVSADAAIMKNWEILERYRLQFRWEMFNALNHPSYALPATDPSAPSSFGQITATGNVPARVMQGGLKLTF